MRPFCGFVGGRRAARVVCSDGCDAGGCGIGPVWRIMSFMMSKTNAKDMKKLTRKITVVLAVAMAWTAAAAPTACYNVIPLPNSVEMIKAKPFVLDAGVTIEAQGDEMVRNARFLAGYIKESTGIVPTVNGEGRPVRLRASLSAGNKEAYTISVSADSVVIDGASPAGVFRGIQTLRKSIPVAGAAAVELPAVRIADAPRFDYRGAHFDVSRHFYNVEEVKTFIDMIALHNLNTFHWHITDDQGWRIEIKKYPKLTTVGSMRDETVIGRNTGKFDGKPHGGFYTQEEAKEIVRYAAERYVNVIPEVNMPGHMTAALAAYPHLGCTGGPYKVWTEWGVTPEVLCAGNDSTMQFIKDVLNEIMDIFPSEYIHIGGDECPKTRWHECPKCQARIKAEGITAKGRFSADDRLQGYVTRYAYEVIKSRGRVMIGWDEILESDIPADALVTSWRGDAGAIEGAKRGNRVILSPNTHLYFDYYQSKDVQFEPLAIGGYVPVEKVYDFEPVPRQLTGEKAKLVYGAQANLWTEYVVDFKQVQYMELPRMAALAEVVWTQPELKDYASFRKRVPALLSIYDNLGYNYAKHLSDVTTKYTTVPERKAMMVEFETLAGRTIRYTLDGSEPTLESPLFEKGFMIDGNTVIKAATFAADGSKSRTYCDTIEVNPATFCKITLNNAPWHSYTYGGGPTLVDGIRGNGSYRTGRWLGFYKKDCDVTIDLGKAIPLSEVAFNCCIFQCDGVVDTSGVELSLSTDGKKYTTVVDETYPEVKRELEFGTVTHRLPFKKQKVRYIHLVVKTVKELPEWHNLPKWGGFVFVDEISVK